MPYYARRKRGPPRRRYSRAVGFRKQAPRLSSGKRRSLYRLSRSGYSARGNARGRSMPAVYSGPLFGLAQDVPLSMDEEDQLWADMGQSRPYHPYSAAAVGAAAAGLVAKAAYDDPTLAMRWAGQRVQPVINVAADPAAAARTLYGVSKPWAVAIANSVKKFAQTASGAGRGAIKYINRRRTGQRTEF